MKSILNLRKYFFSKTAKDTYFVFSGNVFTSFVAFIYTIFLARTFSPSDFGVFSAVLSFSLLVSDISDFGIGTSLSRFLPPILARKEPKKAESFTKTAFLFQLKVAAVACTSVVLLSPFLSKYLLKSASSSYLYLVSAFGILGLIIFAFTTFTLSAQKKFKEVALLKAISTIFKLFFVVILFKLGFLSLFLALLIFSLSSFFAYFISTFFLPLKFLLQKQQKGDLRKLLSFSVYLAFAKIFSATSSRLDALMLIPLSSSFEAGIYSAAFKIVFVYTMLSASFSSVIAPRLSSFAHLRQAVNYLKKVIIVVLLILLTMVLMFVIAPWFVVFVLGTNYQASIEVFRLLLVPMAFFTLTIPPVNFLIYSLKKPQVSTFNTFFSLLLIFLGNLIFIPKLGRLGPVISLTIAYCFTFISASLFALHFYHQRRV